MTAAGREAARRALPLIAVVALALGLRLLVWGWHELYPLGGDEREYLNQALTLLRERRYDELQIMRPPLYTIFLAATIVVADSLVQRLRLVQAILAALTVIPVYGLALALLGSRRVALAAALLVALSYTLAAAATELLTETLFVLLLALLLWLLLAAGRRGGRTAIGLAALAGLTLGALALLRSVALPLLPLAALWLAACRWPQRRAAAALALALLGAAALVIGPWTARNAATYGALIVVDTTGAENLWLDNDPAGREAVKRQLYALGDDMAARQRLAAARGAEAILADPGRFLAKAWGEAQRFFALQFFDDMRDRPAIWVPPAQVWLRLLLGDALWLLLLLGGVAGLWLAPASPQRPDLRWVLVPWVIYTFLTALVFHVELRYRLPLVPALAPYAAWLLVRPAGATSRPRRALALLTCLAAAALLLLHRPYPAEAWALGWKHLRLWQAEAALAAGDGAAAARHAAAAGAHDPRSALARLALARADLLAGDADRARARLDEALRRIPDHPQAHMLRGALLRAAGDEPGARADLAYETATLQDAQRWAWYLLPPLFPPPAALDVGGGLDLGYVRGFHAAEPGGFRWTRGEAAVLLAAPPAPRSLVLRLSAPRPPGAPPAQVVVLVGGREVGRLAPGAAWETFRLPLPDGLALRDGMLEVGLRGDTIRPRDYDRSSPDARQLGVAVDRVALLP